MLQIDELVLTNTAGDNDRYISVFNHNGVVLWKFIYSKFGNSLVNLCDVSSADPVPFWIVTFSLWYQKRA